MASLIMRDGLTADMEPLCQLILGDSALDRASRMFLPMSRMCITFSLALLYLRAGSFVTLRI